ncbi:MAG TPA: ABC transporter substrate-binding protein [Candidatus Binatia bacterium]|jgi:NitT/TauT family transport system substrate-binding protein
MVKNGFFRRSGSLAMTRRLSRAAIVLALYGFMTPMTANANPFLAKPGEAPTTVQVATCAVSGGFIHLYTAMDNGLFEKYGIKVDHKFISGSAMNLAALSADEISFLYCAADGTIPGLASGVDGKLIASPLIGLPYVLLAHKDIKRLEDLKGKSIGVSKAGDLDDRLMKTMLKKFNLSTADVSIRPIGGSQPERYNAMMGGIVQAAPVTPPLDARGRKDGLNVIFNLKDLNLPFIYSSVHTNLKTLKERPQLVQRFVAAVAEAVHFAEKNPDKAKASLSKVLRINDSEILQSAYDAYAVSLVNRAMLVPANALAEAVEVARDNGTNVRKKPAELFDNSFAEQLTKSGFLKELWGRAVVTEIDHKKQFCLSIDIPKRQGRHPKCSD